MKIVPSLFVSLAAVLACVGAAGCAADSAQPEDGVESAEQGLGQTIDVPNPSGAYFASVTANGTGCLPGTWEAAISPDGKAFTVTFSAYEAVVEPGQAFSIKDCNIGIDLRSPQGLSYSVGSFYYQGYTLLDQPGMSVSQSAKYYFQGNPLPARENRSDLQGPYDNSYVFSDDIGIVDLVWSPCGATRRLNALTRLQVRNNSSKSGSGYTNTSAVDATVDTKFRFVFGLNWRTC
jgi:hypothetical protein